MTRRGWPTGSATPFVFTAWMERFSGKVCVVTGGAGGLGRAMCERLADEGATVAVADIDLAAARATAATIGRGAEGYLVDVTDDASVRTLYRTVADAHGGIDVLVNNAGILDPTDTTPEDTDPAVWHRVIAINLTGVWNCCRHGIPHLEARGGGAIVNLGSISGIVGSGHPQTAYAASKGGVIAMTREIAISHAKRNIRCNAVCPGPIRTPMLDALLTNDEERAKRVVHLPDGRFGLAHEIAAAVAYLASDDATWTNGTYLTVDGGLSVAYTTAD